MPSRRTVSEKGERQVRFTAILCCRVDSHKLPAFLVVWAASRHGLRSIFKVLHLGAASPGRPQ
ncbi:hypothetical protein HPB47_008118 [Ixodes persulcatus]|uniref:Uncharacterized protein n=1 Tax=Ixodes persulcatus TaxID=34615 RepID=A0AC60P5L2_IXOPE|nr:hypothetical protein HPB47_008118 [Ixodes persulcatus]